LAELAAQYGIYHRDIKPENLYLLDGQWCIGDFGLVDFPNKEALTAPERHIGPLYYLAPELLNNPESAPGPADVYSLVKTLWVLATGQQYPLPGHLSFDLEQCRIGSYFTDPRVRPIELLVGRATHLDTAQRPSMRDVAAELEAWLHPDESYPADLALDAVRVRVQPIIQRQLDAKQRQQARQDQVKAVLKAIHPELQQIGAHVEQATGLVPQYGGWGKFSDWPPITELNNMPELSYGQHLSLYIEAPLATLPGSGHILFLSGIALGAMSNDQMRMIAANIVWSGRDQIECVWTDSCTAALGSALETRCWRDLLSGLRDSLPKALSAFATALDQ
jgi:serine/threonine protein kinase